MIKLLRLFLAICGLSCTAAQALAEAGSISPDSPRPGLVITYHCDPQLRDQLRQSLKGILAKRLDELTRSGQVARFQLLMSRYVDSEGFDAVALIQFAGETGLSAWRTVEQNSVAGLPLKSIHGVSIQTVPVDLRRWNRAALPQPGRPTYLIVPYEYLVSKTEYLAYLDAYTLPQFTGWMDEEVLAEHQIYLAKYPAGRSWSALIVLAYRDDQALSQREAVTEKVRARLREVPEWKAVSDNKAKIRVEKAPVVADLIAQSESPKQ
jgi:hypothetical protein